MKKLSSIFLLTAILAGCGTTSGLAPQTKSSGFDGKKQVTIMPHGAACTSMGCPAIGAIWIQDQPDRVGLRFQSINDLSLVRSAHLNIDGKTYNFQNTGNTDLSHTNGTAKSGMVAVTDMDVVDKILESKKTWVRISTNQGNVEAAIIDNGKDSKAYNALKRFKAQVEAAKN